MRTAALTTAALLALLTGCAAPGPGSPTVNVPQAGAAAAPTIPAQPVGEQSERGNLVKKPGEAASFGPVGAEPQVKFVIDKITVGAKCTQQYSQRPEHGTFLRLDVRVETTPQLEQQSFYAINPNDFTTVGADGVTESSLATGSTFTCIDSTSMLPPQLAPASKYRGAIVLDTRNKAGALVLRPGWMSTGGWEWQYGGPA